MALKFNVDSLDGVDESLHQFYSKGDNGYFLEVEGAVSKKKLDEFRDNNINLMKEMEKFKGIDVEKYAEMQEHMLKGTKYTEEDVTKMVEERVGTMRSEFESENSKLKAANQTLGSQLETLLIDSNIRRASSEHGVLPSAIDDVVLRAKSVFKVEDGAAVPYDTKGHIMYGKDGESPMGTGDWVKGLKKSAPHLFEMNSGSGSQGGKGNGKVDTSNMSPLQKISTAISEQ